MNPYALEMKNITKTFPGIKALDNVSLQLKPKQILALVGENGAGKSTLMKVLSGVYPYGSYQGQVEVDGELCRFRGIRDSEAKGIAIIHQELALIPTLSIAENIFLGNEQTGAPLVVDWNKTWQKAQAQLKLVSLHDNIQTRVMDLGMGKQQLIEIVKALARDVKILILDEPTAALNDEESEQLLALLLQLKEQGVSSIIITHKLNEVRKVADEVTIIRDGKIVETLTKNQDEVSEERIIQGMVGRELSNLFPQRTSNIGDICFEVRDWNVFDPLDETRQVLEDINFQVRRGEVLGIAGLMGAGRTELAMSIFGRSYGKNISGSILKDGQKIQIRNVQDAIRHGIAYTTEDRKSAGLILIDDVKKNITLPSLKYISKNKIIDDLKEIQIATEYRKKLRIKSSSILQNVIDLSGGNQQKIIFAKWLLANPDIMILDEPTRGIDVGAKYEIYSVINDLAEKGKTIIMISSELPEILGMCDRVYVMNEGRLVGELEAGEASQESIMQKIMESCSSSYP